jgi:hypothetical protein
LALAIWQAKVKPCSGGSTAAHNERVRDGGTVRAGTSTPAADTSRVCVHHGGNCYITTRDRVGVFLRRAQWLCGHGGAELVPLVHDAGVDLLFISSRVPLQVHDVRDRSFQRNHPVAG